MATASRGDPNPNWTSNESTADASFLPTLSEPNSRAAEAIRSLRTHIVTRHLQSGRRALSVCAASENVGCTFVAANLAVALSQGGINTVLIDTDLNHPKIHRFFRRSASPDGLRQYLAEPNSKLSNFVEEGVLPRLSVLFAGDMTIEARELLTSERFEALIRLCVRKFDATVVDTPPANRSSDVSRICSVVRHCIIVARRNISFVSDVSHLAKQLEADGAQVFGTVLCED